MIKLNSLAEITSSKRIFANEYRTNGIPFYRGKEITQLYKHQPISDLLFIELGTFERIKSKFGVPQENDMLLTAVGTIGSVYLVKKQDEFYFKDGNLIWLRNINDKLVLPSYLFYWLTCESTQLMLMAKSIGSNQRALTIDAFKGCEINLLKLSEQQHIVNTIRT